MVSESGNRRGIGAVSDGVFGRLADGTEIGAVRLTNAGGMVARVIGWGAALQSLHVPDRAGTLADVVLGYDALADYVDHLQFFGATIGRLANRIAGGRFSVDGRACQVPPTDGGNALHGGVAGFDARAWAVAEISGDALPASVTFRRTSPDGEEGFPGTMSIAATYSLSDDNVLTLEYVATTDSPTVVNLTNHTFFNLSGATEGRTALDHRIRISADSITPVDAQLIPTGELQPVEGTAFDFRTPIAIGSRVRDGRDGQIVRGRGYDHNYVLRGGVTAQPKPAVRIEDPASGRVLEIETTEPGLQFYSGNFLDGTKIGKGGLLYRQGDGLCFETQHFPNSPNEPGFPSTRLDPGQTFRSRTLWRFTTSRN